MGVTESVFRALDFLRRRKRQYQFTFGNLAGQDVLIDLAKFCRASETCFHEDPRKHAVLEGRREVWLRIEQHLRLNSEQLYALYAGHQFNPNKPEDDDNG